MWVGAPGRCWAGPPLNRALGVLGLRLRFLLLQIKFLFSPAGVSLKKTNDECVDLGSPTKRTLLRDQMILRETSVSLLHFSVFIEYISCFRETRFNFHEGF